MVHFVLANHYRPREIRSVLFIIVYLNVLSRV